MKRLLLILAVLAPALGCDTSVSGPDPLGVVSGIDLDALFAAPGASEVEAVLADWASRDVSVQGYRLEQSSALELARRQFQARIVSHTVTGQRHYGAIVVPEGAEAGRTPVLLYLHGGDGGVSVDGELDFVTGFFADIRDRFIYVVPSFRDEPLRFDGQTWRSEGPASPWDYDVDDAIALLNVALETVPEADAERIAAFGFSRGGGVALLMGARDARIGRVVDYFGPTDFFGPFVQEVTIEALEGRPRDLPGLDFMNANYLVPLREGTLTPAQLRTQIVRRSAVLFVDRMPPVQLHHGEADTVVPVSQAESLIEAMGRAGKQAPEFEGFLYEGGEHNPISLVGAFDRSNAFLREFADQ